MKNWILVGFLACVGGTVFWWQSRGSDEVLVSRSPANSEDRATSFSGGELSEPVRRIVPSAGPFLRPHSDDQPRQHMRENWVESLVFESLSVSENEFKDLIVGTWELALTCAGKPLSESEVSRGRGWLPQQVGQRNIFDFSDSNQLRTVMLPDDKLPDTSTLWSSHNYRVARTPDSAEWFNIGRAPMPPVRARALRVQGSNEIVLELTPSAAAHQCADGSMARPLLIRSIREMS